MVGNTMIYHQANGVTVEDNYLVTTSVTLRTAVGTELEDCYTFSAGTSRELLIGLLKREIANADDKSDEVLDALDLARSLLESR
jgi:hypothetical protein